MTFNPNPTNQPPYSTKLTEFYDWWVQQAYVNVYAPNGTISIVFIDGILTSIAASRDTYGVFIYFSIGLQNGVWVAQGFNPSFAISAYVANPEWLFAPPTIQNVAVPYIPPNLGGNTLGGVKRFRGSATETLTTHQPPDPSSPVVDLKNLLKPQIKDYFTGYSLDTDPYKVDIDLAIVPPKNGTIRLHFYHLEAEIQVDSDEVEHPVVSILTQRFECRKNEPFRLGFTCIPCSISLEGDADLCQFIKDRISMAYAHCFPEDLPVIKASWDDLYEAEKALLLANSGVLATIDLETKPYVWAATARWGQTTIIDVNTNQGVGETIDDAFIYTKYFEPQSDATFGRDIMPDSALLKQIGFTVDSEKWGVNPDNPAIPRVDNLGWRIQRGNEVWGIRVKHDGTIDEALEKTTNRRLHVDGTAENDPQKYNPNCFGSEGMLVRHLPNKFSTAGLRSGGYRKVKDIPQILAELHEQANAAMGYQEGTAIEIQVDGQTYRYPNQLALMTELFVTAKQTATYSKGAFFSSLIGEQSIKEVMAGLGLRTVDKYLEFDVAGRTAKLYYKGISASQSIRRKMSALATNIGITIGNII
jgi:hypothetical protein